MNILRRCAKEYNWSHQDMMKMSKRVLWRYYGYMLIDNIKESERRDKQEQEEKFKEGRENAQWKQL